MASEELHYDAVVIGSGQSGDDVDLHNLYECIRDYTFGLRNTFATPGTLLISIGLFIVIMAGINRVDNKISGRTIGSDWI
jgi:hypothetical protein